VFSATATATGVLLPFSKSLTAGGPGFTLLRINIIFDKLQKESFISE
jgi:hypothetical protein